MQSNETTPNGWPNAIESQRDSVSQPGVAELPREPAANKPPTLKGLCPGARATRPERVRMLRGTEPIRGMISTEIPNHETIYARVKSEWKGREQEGLLRLFVGKSKNEIWTEVDLRLTTVEGFGCGHFFQAARDYILENNTRIFISERSDPLDSDPETVFRLCVMREEATDMIAYDALNGMRDGLTGGEKGGVAVSNNPFIVPRFHEETRPAVIINGNQCFFMNGARIQVGKIADKCHGRVIRNFKIAPISSDNFDHTTKPADGSPLAGPDPIPPGNIAGDDGKPGTPDDIPNPLAGKPGGKHIGNIKGYPGISWSFRAGRAKGQNAIGGLSTNYSSKDRIDDPHQMMGFWNGEHSGKGCIFSATEIRGTGKDRTIKIDSILSGVSKLSNSSDTNAIRLFILDSGKSVDLIHITPSGELNEAFIGMRSSTGIPHYVNNYLLFYPKKPRP